MIPLYFCLPRFLRATRSTIAIITRYRIARDRHFILFAHEALKPFFDPSEIGTIPLSRRWQRMKRDDLKSSTLTVDPNRSGSRTRSKFQNRTPTDPLKRAVRRAFTFCARASFGTKTGLILLPNPVTISGERMFGR